MNENFSRVLALLRQEKGVSQRKAAGELGISQALLSHYEKGVREPGLEFVVKACDFYNVSADFLLGRSMSRDGTTILDAESLYDVSLEKDNVLQGSVMATLGKKLPVISQWSYEALRISPCRYDGSAYTGDLIIAAHNYISHFADLSRLQPGERVTFTDVEGNVFAYDVTEVTTVTPDAVEELKSGDWDLTLFTCTFGNSYRVVVRCRLV